MMRIISHDFSHGEWIPSECAYGRLIEGNFALSDNLNPHLQWENLPQGTKSLVLACIDPDVPTDRQALNADGEIPAEQPRRDFVHWLVWDIAPSVTGVQKVKLQRVTKKAVNALLGRSAWKPSMTTAAPMKSIVATTGHARRDLMPDCTATNSEFTRLTSRRLTCPTQPAGRK